MSTVNSAEPIVSDSFPRLIVRAARLLEDVSEDIPDAEAIGAWLTDYKAMIAKCALSDARSEEEK